MIHCYGLYPMTSLHDSIRIDLDGKAARAILERTGGIFPRICSSQSIHIRASSASALDYNYLWGEKSLVDAARSADVPPRAKGRQVHFESDGTEGEKSRQDGACFL